MSDLQWRSRRWLCGLVTPSAALSFESPLSLVVTVRRVAASFTTYGSLPIQLSGVVGPRLFFRFAICLRPSAL
ncbi:hypothetical protein BD414DRAFT_480877 [Trametes punicea]|nr:hypothetical protein BD414DRAFT_480877 [Trametes punicea]